MQPAPWVVGAGEADARGCAITPSRVAEGVVGARAVAAGDDDRAAVALVEASGRGGTGSSTSIPARACASKRFGVDDGGAREQAAPVGLLAAALHQRARPTPPAGPGRPPRGSPRPAGRSGDRIGRGRATSSGVASIPVLTPSRPMSRRGGGDLRRQRRTRRSARWRQRRSSSAPSRRPARRAGSPRPRRSPSRRPGCRHRRRSRCVATVSTRGVAPTRRSRRRADGGLRVGGVGDGADDGGPPRAHGPDAGAPGARRCRRGRTTGCRGSPAPRRPLATGATPTARPSRLGGRLPDRPDGGVVGAPSAAAAPSIGAAARRPPDDAVGTEDRSRPRRSCRRPGRCGPRRRRRPAPARASR